MENDEGSTATTGLPNQSDDIDGQTPEVVTEADLRNQHIMDAIDRVARGPPSSSSVHSEDDAMEEGAEELLTEPDEDPEANVIQTRSPSFSSFSDSEDVISPTKEGTRIRIESFCEFQLFYCNKVNEFEKVKYPYYFVIL